MKVHECDACGGIIGGWEGGSGAVCLVCRGYGYHSDVMPLSDSIADAETLEQVAVDAACWEYIPEPSRTLYNAATLGREVIHHIANAYAYAPYAAECAARYAFRAVPGLRA